MTKQLLPLIEISLLRNMKELWWKFLQVLCRIGQCWTLCDYPDKYNVLQDKVINWRHQFSIEQLIICSGTLYFNRTIWIRPRFNVICTECINILTGSTCPRSTTCSLFMSSSVMLTSSFVSSIIADLLIHPVCKHLCLWKSR